MHDEAGAHGARIIAALVNQLARRLVIMTHTLRFASGLTTAVLLATGTAIAAPSPSRVARPAVKGVQLLAILNHDTRAYSNPTRGSRRMEMVSNTRPITGEQTVLPVIAHATDRKGGPWLRVFLPGRPNSHTGWISARVTTPSFTKWQIIVHLSTRRVTVLWNGRPARTFSAVVGKPSTPTPTGRFFVEESVQLGQQGVGGPFALATSARSNVLQEFDGGPGQIALHGRDNVGGVLGTAASHGCVRLADQDVTWLAFRAGPGTPVTIAP
jgi:lipoprotein-anchoring transpeptidase ErfK/SrfK